MQDLPSSAGRHGTRKGRGLLRHVRRAAQQAARGATSEQLEQRTLMAAGLVAAYGFDEGLGSLAVDASGFGNNGSVSGATWSSAGRFGGALSFDGVNDIVNIADAASLDLTAGMTLEAWVQPTQSGWRTVVQKDTPAGLSYALYNSGDTDRPQVHIQRDASSAVSVITGPTALAPNVWSHVAATYDGSTLRLFVNGGQVTSKGAVGTLRVSNNPLHVGGNATWGEYFAGLIDEVRVYNRALSAAEIQADMNTGLSTPDTAAPKVVVVSPLNGATNVAGTANVTVRFDESMLASSITSATLELRDPAGVLVPATVTYNATNNTATLDPTPTLATTTGYYSAKVRGGASGVQDVAGHPLAADYTWYFTRGGAPAFQETIAFDDVVEPTVVRFASDNRVFVAEKSGIIKVFSDLNDTTPTVFADLRTQVHNFWDRGLLGMVLHPNFPATPYIYVLYTCDADIGGTAPKFGSPGVTSDPGPNATTTGAKVSGRLSRLTASGNVMTGSELVLINDWAQQFPSHSIGSLQFGPDGALYASGGDGASFHLSDYGQVGNPFGDPGGPTGTDLTPPTAQGGALRAQDLLSPGDPTTLDGSIIRINPDTGAAMTGNPLFTTGNDANARRIVAEGLRNPFRFIVRPGTSELWIGDVGWNTWEEINRLVAPVSPTYSNFGWPAYEGADRQPGYDDANLTLLENFYANPAAHSAPYYAYHHADQVVPGSGEPTGGSSVTGLAFYNGGTYPSAYDGALFFADYARNRIYVMYEGPDGNPDPNNRAMFRGPAGAPVNLEIGPNGDLFYCDLTGAIRRISFSGGNRAPTAVAAATPTSGASPLTVAFNATGSTDPDPGDVLTYAWDFDNDGQFDDSTAAQPSFTFTTSGTYTVRLRVSDGRGGTSTDSVVINVTSTAPVPVIDLPLTSLRWSVGETITFAGHANDNEDGALPASALSWSLVLLHGAPGSAHEHAVQSFAGVAGGTFVAPDHDYPSQLLLRLTATDSGGLSTMTSVNLDPLTAGLTFQSSPSGLSLSFNGASFVTPFTSTVIVGSSTTLSAPSPQLLNGTNYGFASWSDGGAATHSVVGPATAATYTATFAPAAPPPPPLSINDATVTEGNSGTANAIFTVSLPAAASQDVSVNWATADGTATSAGGDYTAASGTLTIPAGSTSGTISVAVRGDTSIESNETFTVNLSAPVNATVADAQGVGTITNDDAAPVAGLVAAYSFDEGSGASAVDASGFGNTGAVSGAAWSPAGRFGGALSFDGVNDIVSIADAASLDLTAGMTLEAWVQPTQTGWRTVVQKDIPAGLAYALYGSGDANRPQLHLQRDASSAVSVITGPSTLNLNTWSHLAATYDGSTLRLFVNGTQVIAKAALGSIRTSNEPLHVGGNATWGEYFAGLIDEVRVYSRALSAAEIQADMNTGIGGAPPPPPSPTLSINDVTVTEGNAGTTNAVFTVSLPAPAAQAVSVNWATADGTATVANGDYTAASGTLTIPAGSTSGTILVSVRGDTAIEPGETFNVNLSAPVNATISDAQGIGTIANDDAGAVAGLVAAFGFNEGSGTAAADSSGLANTGAVSGAAWTSVGRYGGALSFDGVDDIVNVADANSLDLTAGMTLEAWVRPASQPDWHTVLQKDAAGNLAYSLYGSGDGRPQAHVRRDGASLPTVAIGPAALGLNAWSHLAATYDGATLRLFLNGAQIASRAGAGTIRTSADPLHIGGNAVWGEFFSGLIDEVRVYNRALSAAEIQADMNTAVGPAPSSPAAVQTLSVGAAATSFNTVVPIQAPARKAPQREAAASATQILANDAWMVGVLNSRKRRD